MVCDHIDPKTFLSGASPILEGSRGFLLTGDSTLPQQGSLEEPVENCLVGVRLCVYYITHM